MRIIPVSRKDVQHGVNSEFYAVIALPLKIKLYIHHLEVYEDSFETNVVSLVGAVMMKGRTMYDPNFFDGAFDKDLPIKIYLKVDDKTIQRAMNTDDITTILGNVSCATVVGITAIRQGIDIEQEISNKHERTDLKTETNLENQSRSDIEEDE